MRAIACLILALCLTPTAAWAARVVSPRDTVHAAPVARDTLAGSWRVDDGDPAPIVIRRGGDGYLLDRAERWSGHGRLDGNRYEGEFESQRALGDTMRVAGIHHGRFAGAGRLEISVIYTHGRRGARHEVWRRIEDAGIVEHVPGTPERRSGPRSGGR